MLSLSLLLCTLGTCTGLVGGVVARLAGHTRLLLPQLLPVDGQWTTNGGDDN
jgi:hypothetical protein